MWSRICTTWPENPHWGNCGVPFMNSTTSLPFTSLSIHCSMLIAHPFARRAAAGIRCRIRARSPICSARRPLAQGLVILFLARGVERSFDLHDIVLVETTNLDDRARWIGTSAPQLLLHLVNQRAQPRHVGDVDHDTDRIAQRRALGFGDELHVEEGLPDSRLFAGDERIAARLYTAHSGHEHEVARAGAEAEGSGRPDGAVGRQRFDAL